MRKQKTYILPPLENKLLIAIDKQVKKDIEDQHQALEFVRSEMNSIVSLKYQSQIKSFSHTRMNRIHASQSLHQPIIAQPQKLQQTQSQSIFLNTIRNRFLKSSIEPKNVELLKYYEEEEYYELKEYFKKNPIDIQIQGLTLLYRAVKDQNIKMIGFLLQRGANMHLIQEKWPFRQMTPFQLAKQMNNQDVLHAMHI